MRTIFGFSGFCMISTQVVLCNNLYHSQFVDDQSQFVDKKCLTTHTAPEQTNKGINTIFRQFFLTCVRVQVQCEVKLQHLLAWTNQ